KSIKTFFRIILFTDKEEKYFIFSYQIMGKEREFKLKLFPSLGMAIVFPFIFLFIFLQDSSLEALRGGHPYLYMYFLNIFIIVTVHMLQFSSQYLGAWLFASIGYESLQVVYS